MESSVVESCLPDVCSDSATCFGKQNLRLTSHLVFYDQLPLS